MEFDDYSTRRRDFEEVNKVEDLIEEGRLSEDQKELSRDLDVLEKRPMAMADFEKRAKDVKATINGLEIQIGRQVNPRAVLMNDLKKIEETDDFKEDLKEGWVKKDIYEKLKKLKEKDENIMGDFWLLKRAAKAGFLQAAELINVSEGMNASRIILTQTTDMIKFMMDTFVDGLNKKLYEFDERLNKVDGRLNDALRQTLLFASIKDEKIQEAFKQATINEVKELTEKYEKEKAEKERLEEELRKKQEAEQQKTETKVEPPAEEESEQTEEEDTKNIHEKIVALAEKHPEWKYKFIAEKLGVEERYVSQALARERYRKKKEMK